MHATKLPTSAQADLKAGKPAQGSVTIDGTDYFFAAQPVGRQAFVLLRPKSVTESQLTPFVESLLIATLAGGALAAVAAFVLARRIARPVGRVADAARSLAGGTYPDPIPLEGAAELATLAGAFNDLAVQLFQAREAERNFLLSVSHELKTPLTAIRGYSEALRDGAVTVQDATDTVALEAARLERLVGDLLDLARMNRTDFSVHNSEIDLSEVADDAVRRYQPQADAFGVALIGNRRRPGARGRRRRPRPPGRLEPRRERASADAARRRDPRRRRARPAAGRGHRAGPEAGGARARVRALLPARALRPRAAGRHRARARDREGADPGDGRDRRGGQRPRRPDHVHGAPRRSGAPARTGRIGSRGWPTLEDVERAQRVIQGRVHRTPLLRSATLSEKLGVDARLKAELFQRTGSFKVRGVLNTLSQLADEAKRRGVISISAGNHAQAVAWAAREEGIDALIVMWQGAEPLKVDGDARLRRCDRRLRPTRRRRSPVSTSSRPRPGARSSIPSTSRR